MNWSLENGLKHHLLVTQICISLVVLLDFTLNQHYRNIQILNQYLNRFSCIKPYLILSLVFILFNFAYQLNKSKNKLQKVEGPRWWLFASARR